MSASSKVIVCNIWNSEAPVVTTIWGHWGQVFSIYLPLDFSTVGMYEYTEFGVRREPNAEQWKSILARAEALRDFFNVLADYLHYPEPQPPPKAQSIEPFDDMSQFERYKENIRKAKEQYGSIQKMYEQRVEEVKNANNETLDACIKFFEAKANSLPTLPSNNIGLDDVEIDLSDLGFQLVSGKKQETVFFGDLSIEMPENSIHFNYLGQRGKKVEIDLVKCKTHFEAREFFAKTQDKRSAYTYSDFFTPFVLYRSPNFVEVYKHANTIWIDENWLINIRIPIAKPSKVKSKQNFLPGEKMRAEIISLIIDQFKKI